MLGSSQITDDMFAHFTEEETDALVSLPYRIGLYISYADTTGGWDAQEAEIQSLSNILRAYAEDFCKGEFSQKILMETLRRRDGWPSWSHKAEEIPAEAKQIVHMVGSVFPNKTLRDFKEVLMEIALAVATAYRENEAPAATPGAAKFSVLSDMVARLVNGGKASPFAHQNISRNERAALDRLAKAMNYEIN